MVDIVIIVLLGDITRQIKLNASFNSLVRVPECFDKTFGEA